MQLGNTDRQPETAKETKMYQVTFINKSGNRVTRTVEARNEFEAVQLANAFNCVVISVINLNL